MPISAAMLKWGMTSSGAGTSPSVTAGGIGVVMAMMTAATITAAGTASTFLQRPTASHVTTTARPASGDTATALTGARHSVSNTPASIAEAIGVGMAATARPSGLTTPDSINSAPVIRKAPTA